MCSGLLLRPPGVLAFTGITRNEVQNGAEDVWIMQRCQFGAEDENCEFQIHFLSSCIVE